MSEELITIEKLKSELEHAIKNREDNPDDFTSEFAQGELSAFKEVLRRVKLEIWV